MNQNYQKELEKVLNNPANLGKKLLLHSCCAPCSSYVLVYLSEYFEITVLYYNPNISMQEEYKKRVAEQKRLIETLNQESTNPEYEDPESREKTKKKRYPISFIEGDYNPEDFFQIARGLETCKEGGERCFKCYELRLRESAKYAKEGAFDFFTTTLTISPLKNAGKLNEIGLKLSEEYGVSYLLSDFKKKNGYLTSIALSKQYDLYRQDYCGCVYSKQERVRAELQKQKESSSK